MILDFGSLLIRCFVILVVHAFVILDSGILVIHTFAIHGRVFDSLDEGPTLKRAGKMVKSTEESAFGKIGQITMVVSQPTLWSKDILWLLNIQNNQSMPLIIFSSHSATSSLSKKFTFDITKLLLFLMKLLYFYPVFVCVGRESPIHCSCWIEWIFLKLIHNWGIFYNLSIFLSLCRLWKVVILVF